MFSRIAVIYGVTILVGAFTTDFSRQSVASPSKPHSSRSIAFPASSVQQISDLGLSFLSGHQMDDGSWQQDGQDPNRVTALVLEVLASCVNSRGQRADPHQALAVFRLAIAGNPQVGLRRGVLFEACDFEPRQEAEVNTDALAALVDRLKASQRSDGGWMSDESQRSTPSVIATAEAVLVLCVVSWDLQHARLRPQPDPNRAEDSTVAAACVAIFSRSSATSVDS